MAQVLRTDFSASYTSEPYKRLTSLVADGDGGAGFLRICGYAQNLLRCSFANIVWKCLLYGGCACVGGVVLMLSPDALYVEMCGRAGGAPAHCDVTLARGLRANAKDFPASRRCRLSPQRGIRRTDSDSRHYSATMHKRSVSSIPSVDPASAISA